MLGLILKVPRWQPYCKTVDLRWSKFKSSAQVVILENGGPQCQVSFKFSALTAILENGGVRLEQI